MPDAKLLIVDDSGHIREFLAGSVLRPAGYTVLEAADGQAGLQLAQEHRPDLIIADLQMPGLSGLELKQALAATGDHTPFILITAEGSEAIASQATLAGVSYYLTKPVDLDVMLAAVAQALDVERLRHERAEALATLEQRVHQLETLQAIGRALSASLDVTQIQAALVEAAVRLAGADGGSLFLQEPADPELWLRTTTGPLELGVRAVRQPAGDPLASAVLESSHPIIYPAPCTARPMDTSGPPRVYVPLRQRDVTQGVLAIDNRLSKRLFSAADVGPLAMLADYGAAALANAHLVAELQRQSITDALTGIANRRHLFTMAEQEAERARRFGRRLSAVMLDIDYFKQINDTRGHAAGDQVLTEVARRCQRSKRAVDLIGRYGGDEFALLLPETDIVGARRLSERLRQTVAAKPVATHTGQVSVTISLGVASAGPTLAGAAALLARADEALYAAKQAGRNRVSADELC